MAVAATACGLALLLVGCGDPFGEREAFRVRQARGARACATLLALAASRAESLQTLNRKGIGMYDWACVEYLAADTMPRQGGL